jgi:hypothetical protein
MNKSIKDNRNRLGEERRNIPYVYKVGSVSSIDTEFGSNWDFCFTGNRA